MPSQIYTELIGPFKVKNFIDVLTLGSVASVKLSLSLGIYLTIVMAMTSVSVIMTVFVLNLHYRGPNLKPLPQWLRRCFVKGARSREKGLCFNKRSATGKNLFILSNVSIQSVQF